MLAIYATAFEVVVEALQPDVAQGLDAFDHDVREPAGPEERQDSFRDVVNVVGVHKVSRRIPTLKWFKRLGDGVLPLARSDRGRSSLECQWNQG